MATAFGLSFNYVQMITGSHNDSGDYVHGTPSLSTMEGSIHPMTAKEVLAYTQGSRTTGMCKVIASEFLDSRVRAGNEGVYIAFGVEIYQLGDCNPYQNGIIPHYELVGNMVPDEAVPDGVRELLFP